MPEATALVMAVILDRPRCIACTVEKTGLTREQVTAALRTIQSVIGVDTAADAPCTRCGITTVVVSARRR
jgi:hypothetical protein